MANRWDEVEINGLTVRKGDVVETVDNPHDASKRAARFVVDVIDRKYGAVVFIGRIDGELASRWASDLIAVNGEAA